MRVPQLPDLSVFRSAQSNQYDGMIAGLTKLFSGFSTAVSAKKRKFAFEDNEQGRTLGSFLSILTGGHPSNPVTAVTPDGIQRMQMPVVQPVTQPTPSYSLPPPNK